MAEYKDTNQHLSLVLADPQVMSLLVKIPPDHAAWSDI